jgi:hypothetical protein
MHEISNQVMLLWTIGTFIFSAGFGWAGIKLGQRQMAEMVKEVRRDVRSLTERLHTDEKDYMSKKDCDGEQSRCGKDRNYHESNILVKLDDLKSFMIETDNKRESTRTELSLKLSTISTELAVLKHDLARGPVPGAPI